jgi:hypothetical protein
VDVFRACPNDTLRTLNEKVDATGGGCSRIFPEEYYPQSALTPDLTDPRLGALA